MKGSLQQHLEQLDKQHARNVYMLKGDIDMRACCKSLREHIKRLLPDVSHHVVWLRVEGGVLMLVGGPYIITRLLCDFVCDYNGGVIANSKKLYSGTGRKTVRQLVQDVLAAGYVPAGKRSFGASRP